MRERFFRSPLGSLHKVLLKSCILRVFFLSNQRVAFHERFSLLLFERDKGAFPLTVLTQSCIINTFIANQRGPSFPTGTQYSTTQSETVLARNRGGAPIKKPSEICIIRHHLGAGLALNPKPKKGSSDPAPKTFNERVVSFGVSFSESA